MTECGVAKIDEMYKKDIVFALEEVLELAKKGKIKSICIIRGSSDMSLGWTVAGHYSNSQMLGDIETTKLDFHRSTVDE